jgi:hypothetical protein
VRADLRCQRQQNERGMLQHRSTPAAADEWVDSFGWAGKDMGEGERGRDGRSENY